MKTIYCILLSILTLPLYAQVFVRGIVLDENQAPVFAANIHLKSAPGTGTITDFDGKFTLELKEDQLQDSLCISYVGYEAQQHALENLDSSKPIQFKLKESQQTLATITVIAEDPISEQFAATKLERLEIYLNPVAAADPLRAITALPASTNTDETANPSLRGSDADRSRVVFNGVPIYRPVRNSQINGIGNFSLFNTELIHKQYVYASNPPLTFGNTSAGLVEIETIRALPYEQTQLSTSLANLGLFTSQKIKEKAFIQAYSNFQFSEAFIGLNKASFPHLKDFGSLDVGLNFHYDINKRWSLNWFSYSISETYEVLANAFAFEGKATGNQKRNFNILNLKHIGEKSIFTLNHGQNFSSAEYQFGAIQSDNVNQLFYTAANYQYFLNPDFHLQIGLTHDFSTFKFKGQVPELYFNLQQESPTLRLDLKPINHNLEAYAYSTWDLDAKLQLSTGIRKNIRMEQQEDYWSYQFGFRWAPNTQNNILLSAGQYHNYNTPNYFYPSFALLKSRQVALDYSIQLDDSNFNFAGYFKKEKGDQLSNDLFLASQNRIFGLEAAVTHTFNDYFQASFAYSFLDSKVKLGESWQRGEKDLNYFIKASIQFNHSKLFSTALTYMGRSGKYFTPITGGHFLENQTIYQPIFDRELNQFQFEDYHNISFSINRYFRFSSTALIAFLSVNNILNIKNQRNPVYSFDYSEYHFDHYQLRSIYVGFVWQWNQ